MDDVVIRITGNTNDLQPTIDKLKELGKVDSANEQQFKKTHDTFKKGAEDSKKHASEFGDEVGRIEGKMRNLTERIIAVFAVERIIEFGKECVKAFAAAEAQAQRLEFAVTKINGQGGLAFKQLVEQSEQLAKSLNNLFTPKQIQSAQTQLANFGLTSEMIKKLIPKVLDMSRATGKDLNEAIEKSILAINGQTKGLRDVGIAFKDTGSKTENFNLLLKDMEKFTGSAAASLDTTDGKLTSMKNTFEEVEVSIGEVLVGTGKALLTWLGDIGSGFWSAVQEGLKFAHVIDNVKEKLNFTTASKEELQAYIEQTRKSLEARNKSPLKGLFDKQDSLTAEGAGETAMGGGDVGKKKFEATLLPNQLISAEKELFKRMAEEMKKGEIAENIKKIEKTKKGLLGFDELDYQFQLDTLKEHLALMQDIKDDATLTGEANAKKAADDAKKAELDRFDNDYKSVLKQLAAQDKITQESHDSLRKENDDYHQQLLDANLDMSRRNEELNAEEQRVLEELQRNHEAKILKIIEDANLQQKKLDDAQLKENIRQLGYEEEAKRIALKGLLVDKKITQEQYQQKLDELELGAMQRRLEMEQQAGMDDVELQQKIEEQKLKVKQDAMNQNIELAQRDIDLAKQTADAIFKIEIEQSANKEKILDEQLSREDKQITLEANLAAKGMDNDLGFEKTKAAQLEKQKLDEIKRQQKLAKEQEAVQLVLAYFNSFANYSKTEDSRKASLDAFRDVLAAKVIATALTGKFHKGGIVGVDGNIGASDIDRVLGGNLDHDESLALVKKGEGFLSQDEMKMIGQDGFYGLKAMLKNPIPNDYYPTASINMKGMEQGLNDLKQAFNDIPRIHTGIDDLGRIVETAVQNHLKRTTIKKPRDF